MADDALITPARDLLDLCRRKGFKIATAESLALKTLRL